MEPKVKRKRNLKWKILDLGPKHQIQSRHMQHPWEVGEWYHTYGYIETCCNGFHCSDSVLQAMNYVNGAVVARVEVRGSHSTQADKSAWREMRIVRAYRLTRRDLRDLVRFLKKKGAYSYNWWNGGDLRSFNGSYEVVRSLERRLAPNSPTRKSAERWINKRLKEKKRL